MGGTRCWLRWRNFRRISRTLRVALRDAALPALAADADGAARRGADVVRSVVVLDGAVVVIAPEIGDAQPARLVRHEQALYVDLPPLPDLRALVEVASWAALEDHKTVRIDAAAVRRAVEQGDDAARIIASLAALIGVPLDRRDADQVRAWVKTAHSLTLARCWC